MKMIKGGIHTEPSFSFCPKSGIRSVLCNHDLHCGENDL